MFRNTEIENSLANRIFLNKLEDSLYFPKYLEIETIRACNAKCVMCTIKDWENKDSVIMKDEVFTKLVNEVSHYSKWIETITLNKDGEPTLDKNLSKKIFQLKQVGIKNVRFTTNCEKLTSEMAKDVLQAGVDEVMFSIDSIDKKTYEKIRIGLNLDIVLENIIGFIDLRNKFNPKTKISIRMIEMEENTNEKHEWLKFWNDKVGNNDNVCIMPMHTWGNQLTTEEDEKVSFYTNMPCISPFSSFVIHSDGKVGMCAIDYNSKYLMGDFTKNSIKEIWINEKFTQLRKNHLNSNRNCYSICKGCDIWDKSFIDQ